MEVRLEIAGITYATEVVDIQVYAWLCLLAGTTSTYELTKEI